jgi:hypothetical protein
MSLAPSSLPRNLSSDFVVVEEIPLDVCIAEAIEERLVVNPVVGRDAT